MSEAIIQPPRHPRRATLPPATPRPSGQGSLYQDPAMILIAALGISFVTLVLVTGWLLVHG